MRRPTMSGSSPADRVRGGGSPSIRAGTTRDETSVSTFTPAGWYDDGHGSLRWWDGARWTEHTHAPAAVAHTVPAADAAPAEAAGVPADAAPAAATAAPAYANTGASTATAPAYGADPSAVPVTPSGPEAAQPGASAPRSKLWILFVALGVVVVGMVVAAALIVPRLVGDLVDQAERGSSWSAPDSPAFPAEPDDPEPLPEQVTGPEADEAGAVVAAYDDAWNSGDCDAYHATLSDDLRESAGWTCDEFVIESQAFVDSLDEYEVTIVSTARAGDEIVVSTVETYLQVTDIDGAPLDVPQPGSVSYDYTLVEVDGAWVIDDITEP